MREFVGGMNVPSALGRFNATWPLATLVITDEGIRLRPRTFARVFSGDYDVPLSEIAVAFPLRGLFMTSGVGFELADGAVAYFWTWSDQRAILDELWRKGVQIDGTPRRASKVWFGGRSSGSNNAKMPRPLQIATPFLLLASVALMIVFASSGTVFGWFVAVIGLVGAAQLLLSWRRSRG